LNLLAFRNCNTNQIFNEFKEQNMIKYIKRQANRQQRQIIDKLQAAFWFSDKFEYWLNDMGFDLGV
jgi:hypothetical protein